MAGEKHMISLKTVRQEHSLSIQELGNIAKVQPHKIKIAETGLDVLTTAEANRLSKILGFKETPEFIGKLINDEVFDDER